MKKLIATLLFVTATFNYGAHGNSGQMVYICIGSTAYAYHKNLNCKGLNRCKAQIKRVTLSEAYIMGRNKPCGYCYN